MSQEKNVPSFFLEDLAPWNENENSIWLASKLQLSRNIEKFHFPGKLSLEQRKKIVNLIGKEKTLLEKFQGATLLKSEDCTPLDKEFLVEHCLTNEGFLQALQGEAFLFDRFGASLITINIEDHLHFHFIDVLGELEKGWNHLVSLEQKLGEVLSFAYSPKFGFLTASPLDCGTGLIVSIFIQPSALIHTGKFETTLEKLKDDSIVFTGLMGHPKELVGDLTVIRNNYSLGCNEETIIASLRSFATKIVAEESLLRRDIKKSGHPELMDKVARAYALLVHSYQIEAIEALNEIALLKLGLEMEWVKGIPMSLLNKLFFTCRRGHLLRQFQEKIPIESVSHKRAEFIHKALKGAELTI